MASLSPLLSLSSFSSTSSSSYSSQKSRFTSKRNSRFGVVARSPATQSIVGDAPEKNKKTSEYRPGPLDDLLFKFFRRKMVEEVGWDSEKPGYDGLIEVATRLMMKNKTNIETELSAVRVLKSLFPPFLLPLYKRLITPIGGGKPASMMLARATALSCQWLMGTCSVNSIELPDGSSCSSGVFVEKCRYLEESRCVGVCVNTCKLPTQTFFNDSMGVPLYMEPNFTDYSCQFKFGVPPPPQASDTAFREPCLEICPNANRRRELGRYSDQCPKV